LRLHGGRSAAVACTQGAPSCGPQGRPEACAFQLPAICFSGHPAAGQHEQQNAELSQPLPQDALCGGTLSLCSSEESLRLRHGAQTPLQR
jgi:hypothetical protein